METCKEEERETNQQIVDEFFCCSGPEIEWLKRSFRVNSRFMKLYNIQGKMEQNLLLSKSHHTAPLSSSWKLSYFICSLPGIRCDLGPWFGGIKEVNVEIQMHLNLET